MTQASRAKRLLLATTAAALAFAFLRPVANIDAWLHLAAGELIGQSGSIPRFDVFSWTVRGRPWLDHEWLYQVLLHRVFGWGGYAGLILFKAAVLLATFALVRARLERAGVHWLAQPLALGLAWFLGRGWWTERPDHLTFLLAAYLLWRLESPSPPRRPPWAAPAEMLALGCLWANLHGGVLLGGGILGVHAAGGWVKEKRFPRASAAAAAAFGLGTLLNPYGLELHASLLGWTHTLSRGQVWEWQAPRWETAWAFWFCLAALWASWAWEWRRSRRPELAGLGVSLAVTWLAVRHARFVPLFGLTALPYAFLNASRAFSGALPGRLELRAAVLAVVLAAAAAAQAARGIAGGVDAGASYLTDEAFRFIKDESVQGPFYNDYPLGASWIWRFKGDPPVFIDGRVSSVGGYDDLLRELVASQASGEAWNAFLDRWGVQAALVRYPAESQAVRPPLFAAYFPRARWSLVYWDDLVQLFVRKSGPNAGLGRRLEFKAVSPEITEASLRRALEEGLADRGAWLAELGRHAGERSESWRNRRLRQLVEKR